MTVYRSWSRESTLRAVTCCKTDVAYINLTGAKEQLVTISPDLIILPSSIWHPLGPPRPPWCAPGRRSSPPGHPCSLVQCPRLTCGGYALLFVIAGSLRIDLFQHANPRPRQVRAGRRARLLALRVLLALSAGPTGATRPPCRPARLLGGHSRVRSARCGLRGPILGGCGPWEGAMRARGGWALQCGEQPSR